MISIKTHGIVDYCLGAAFFLAPYLFGFSDVYFAHDVFTVMGLAIIGYSLLTDYRSSVARAVPLSMHMTFDVAAGIFVVLAPWIYGYRELLTPFQSALHWIMGMATIGLVAFTHGDARPSATVLTPEAEAMAERPLKKAA
jgi:hypothetical protein